MWDKNFSGYNTSDAFSESAGFANRLLRQGGPVSVLVNNILPGGHAISGMHEGFQIMAGSFRSFVNVPGMFVAAGITYPALLSQTPGISGSLYDHIQR